MFPKVSVLEGVDLTNLRFETILVVLHIFSVVFLLFRPTIIILCLVTIL